MIIKIGGTNGSGKTTLMREILRRFDFHPVQFDGKEKIAEYVAACGDIMAPFKRIVVLGDYRNICGGMDTISDKEVRLGLVEKYAKDKRTLVLYEGLITGKTYGAMGALSERKGGVPWIYAYMDTPFEMCVARVLSRRKERGTDTPFDPERTMRPTFRACNSTMNTAKLRGHTVHSIHYADTPKKAVGKLLNLALKIARAS